MNENAASHQLHRIDPATILVDASHQQEYDRLIHSRSGRQHYESLDTVADEKERTYQFRSISPLNIKSNDIVTIHVEATVPDVNDWVAAYVPASADVTTVSPVKFGLCSLDPHYMLRGEAHLDFNLTNQRADIRFHYFRNGLMAPLLVATSEDVVEMKNINEPVKPRIVPSGDPDVYKLLWSSSNSTLPLMKWGLSSISISQQQQQQHHWETEAVDPLDYPFTIPATTTTITKDSLCGIGSSTATTIGWMDLGMIHTATITGILELQRQQHDFIYYVIGDASSGNFSEEMVFLLPPPAGTRSRSIYAPSSSSESSPQSEQPLLLTRPTRVLLLADLGVGTSDSSFDSQVWSEACHPAVNTSNSMGERVRLWEVDAVFHSGDVSYANGYLSNWDYFMDMISPIASKVLYLTTLGNHESVWPGTASIYQSHDSGGECGVLSTSMLPLPHPATLDQPWWSYDIGSIHLVGIGTEHNYSVDSPQYRWLEEDLRSINRTHTPWVIFSGHRPMYVDSSACCGWGVPDDVCDDICLAYTNVGVMRSLQDSIEPLLQKYRVNLAFAGHFHNVQRQSAVFQGKVMQRSSLRHDDAGNEVHFQDDPNATVWMVIGSAGNGPTYSDHMYPWSEASWDELYGYALVTAVNDTYLSWEFIDSATDRVIDRLVITQDFEPWWVPVEGGTPPPIGVTSQGQAYYSPVVQIVVVIIGCSIFVTTLAYALCKPKHGSSSTHGLLSPFDQDVDDDAQLTSV